MTAPTPPKPDWVDKDTAGHTAADWTIPASVHNNVAAWITYLNTQLAGKQPLDADLTAIAALVDPNADRLLFWDDSAGTWLFLTLGTNLSITGTTLNATGGAGGGDASTNTTTSVVNEAVQFADTGGKTFKRSTFTGVIKQTAGVESVDANLTQISALVDPNADRILFWDDSAGAWTHLTLGTNLSITGTTLNAAGGAGSGDVVGPASATDNAVARFDTATGKLLQTSLASVDDSGNVSALNTFHSFATTVTAAGITTLTVASPRTQELTGVTTHTVRLPTTGVPQGAEWMVVNNSTGVVTVQSSGANTVLAMGASTRAVFTAKVATPTTSAHWTASITGGTYQAPISLTTTGTSGAATFVANTLNIPQYSAAGGGTDVPSGWADVTKSPYNANNNYPTNSASSGNAIRAAAATGLPVWIPAGSYLFDGAGISQDNLFIAGPGPGKVQITLGAGVYFIDGTNIVNTLKLSGILFDGGAGVFRSTYTGVAVQGYRIFENCQFHNYTATAIGHRHQDSPYWGFYHCEFRGANDTACIGVALNGLNDDNMFHHCTFELNRIHLKLKEGANAHISGGCSFFRWVDYTANPRIDIWIVPRTAAEVTAAGGNFADAGSGFSIQETKFGNEGLSGNDYRVVIADALAGNFETALPQLAANSTSVWIGGTFTNLHNSLIGGTCPPFIYSTTPNLYAVSAGNFAHIGSDSLAAARVLQLRTATGFDPTINAIGPVMTGADSLFGQTLVAATTGTLTGQPPYVGAGGSGGGGGGLDAEGVRDTIAAALVQGSGVTITPNDAANTITVAANVLPIPFGVGTPTVGFTLTDRAYFPRTLTGARMRATGAPAGSALTVQVQHSSNSGGSWSSVGSALSIAAGSTTEAVVSFSQAQVAGDWVRLSFTSVGSTTPAAGVSVDVIYT